MTARCGWWSASSARSSASRSPTSSSRICRTSLGFFRRGAGDLWVAVAGDKVVGTIGLVDIGNGQGAIRKMFVDCAYRGREAAVAQRR